MVHGGIDGYSRLITYLSVSTNNLAETVLRQFVKAADTHGVPSRVCMDYGAENRDVAEFMLIHRGTERGSVITGKSVHNQRIERLWRDVFNGVLATFYNLFSFLEEQRLLDVYNSRDMFCLHYVFLPRLQAKVRGFQSTFNEHGLQTEGGMTQKQLYTSGTLLNFHSSHTGVRSILDRHDSMDKAELDGSDWQNYGIDYDGPVPVSENMISEQQPRFTEVHVPEVECPFSPEIKERLNSEFDSRIQNPECDSMGLSLYLEILDFVDNTQN